METEVNSISINGIEYIPKGEVEKPTETLDGKEYVIIRTYSAGVFAGYLNKKDGQEVQNGIINYTTIPPLMTLSR